MRSLEGGYGSEGSEKEYYSDISRCPRTVDRAGLKQRNHFIGLGHDYLL